MTLLPFLCASFVSCTEAEEEKLTLPPRETVTEEVGKRYDYDLNEYMNMGEPLGVKAEFDDPTVCTEKEIDDAVFQIRLASAKFEEKSGKAERYDKVKVSYTVELDGEALADHGKTDREIVIGLEAQDELEYRLGETLIGIRAGESRTAVYTYPETASYGELAGKTVDLVAKVSCVYDSQIPEENEAFVRGLEGFSFQTVAEFRESVKKDILEEKESRKVQAVWAAFYDTVEILKYPEKELNAYLNSYRAYYEDLAENMGLSVEKFLEEYLETDEANFMAEAEEYARELVKNDMILTQLARELETTLSDEEYEKGLKEYFENESGSFTSIEEYVEYYTEENIRQNLIWDKALRTVIEHAVPAA